MSTATVRSAAAREAIEAAYRSRTARSAAFLTEAQRYIPGGVTRSVAYHAPYPLCIASGAGCRVRDLDGNEYLDHLSNFGSMIHGHGHPRIIAAITEQLGAGTDFGAPNERQVALAREIVGRVPSIERVRFATSGSEAVLYAVRAARAFTGKPKLLKMEGSYHGASDSVSVSVEPGVDAPAWPRGKPARGVPAELASQTLVAPYNDLERATEIIRAHKDELAAVIVEPVMVRGPIAADVAFLWGLREATREAGVLLIFDEVVTFRLSTGGAQHVVEVAPDLTTLGKSIGGGLPVGAFGGRADVMDAFDASRPDAVSHSGTFTGNAAVTAGGLAALSLLTADEIERINSLGDRLRAALRDTATSAGVPVQATGAGSLVAVHFADSPVRDYRSALATNREAMRWLHLAMVNRGVFARANGSFFLSTPMRDAEVDETVAAFADALEEIRPILQS
jgi:glutamate-1-semialdehyde 2,1-aminomutase